MSFEDPSLCHRVAGVQGLPRLDQDQGQGRQLGGALAAGADGTTRRAQHERGARQSEEPQPQSHGVIVKDRRAKGNVAL